MSQSSRTQLSGQTLIKVTRFHYTGQWRQRRCSFFRAIVAEGYKTLPEAKSVFRLATKKAKKVCKAANR